MPTQFINQWNIVHIAGCLVAFAGFAASFVASAGYMLQGRMLKTKRINVLQRFLPALDRAERVAYKTVAFGFIMLTFGIITGVLWSQSRHGTWWSWTAKETWSLITWLVYAAYLHVRVVSGWRGHCTNWLILVGFACMVITLFVAISPVIGWHI